MSQQSRLQLILRDYLNKSRRSARDLSLASGLNESYVKAILAGRATSPRGDSLKKLAAEMGMSVEYLLSPYIGEVTRAVHSNPKPDDLADEVVKHEERNLPVHETLENTDRLYPDTMLMVTEPIQWLRRPDPLIGVPRSFGCYVNDDRSSPVFERGDLIFVHPYRPPRVGDDCLFCSGGMWDFRTDLEAPVDEKVVRIGRLMGRTKSTWTVRQFNPDDEFFLDAEDWGAWLIVGKYSRA